MRPRWLRWTSRTPRPRSGPRPDRSDVTATEIAEFAYCPRAWWLRRRQGCRPDGEDLAWGAAAHARAGDQIRSLVLVEWYLRGLIVLAIASAVIAGVVVFYR